VAHEVGDVLDVPTDEEDEKPTESSTPDERPDSGGELAGIGTR
jgi:hypothetical protein